jgi:hypothetical protein
MPSIKRLNSISNSIAQHSVSGLSYVHPHLSLACKQFGLKSMQVNLNQNDPCPELFKSIEAVHLSLISLRKRFEQMVLAEGFTLDDIREITLLFEIPEYSADDYCMNCTSRLVSKTGKVYIHAINCLGRPRPIEQV